MSMCDTGKGSLLASKNLQEHFSNAVQYFRILESQNNGSGALHVVNLPLPCFRLVSRRLKHSFVVDSIIGGRQHNWFISDGSD